MGIVNTSIQYGKIAVGYTVRVIAPFFFGITLNWLFAIFFMVGWLRTISVWNSLPALVMIAVFFAGFPFLYFWLARGYAIRKGIEFLYNGSQGVVAKVVGFVVESAVAKKEKQEDGSMFKTKKGGVKKAGDYIHKVQEKIPRPIRSILKFILEEMPLQNMIVEVGEEVALNSENIDEIKPKVQEKVNNYVINALIGADLTWFWLLSILNVGIMFLGWWFILK